MERKLNWDKWKILTRVNSKNICLVERCMKSVQIRSFSGPYFPLFGLNTGKHGPEKTPYLDTFDAVNLIVIPSFFIQKNDISENVRYLITLSFQEHYREVQNRNKRFFLASCFRNIVVNQETLPTLIPSQNEVTFRDYLETLLTSKMKLFEKIVNSNDPSKISQKGSILNIWQGSEYDY